MMPRATDRVRRAQDSRSARRPPGGVALGVLLVAGLLAAAAPARAQTPGLTLVLTVSPELIAPGGTVRVTIGAVNQGGPVAVDVYVAVLLPDGDSMVAVLGPAGFAPGRLSQLAALPPLVAGVTLPTGFSEALEDFLVYTFTGIEPPGPYRIFLAAVRPGSLADGVVDPGDLLALATAQVTLGPPLTVTPDSARAATAEVTPEAGGTVTATGADGISYRLSVPPGAVGEPTPVTLTPVTAVTGLGGGDLLAAVQGGPAGLQFARPARLTIEVPGGVPETALLAALVADDGTGATILPLAAGATRIELEIGHFSAVAIPRDVASLNALNGQTTLALAAWNLLRLAQTTPLDPHKIQTLLDHLITWYDGFLRPVLSRGPGTRVANFLSGLREFLHWEVLRLFTEEGFAPHVPGVLGRLTSRAEEGRNLSVAGLGQAFTRANDDCRASLAALEARLGEADTAARFALLAEDYFGFIERQQPMYPHAIQIPSPDLAAHGLDAPTAAAHLCVKVLIDDVTEPSLAPGQTGTLTVRAGVSFDGGPPDFSPAVAVTLCPDPTSTSTAGCTARTRTDATGRVSFPVTATAGGEVRYLVCAQVHPADFIGLFQLMAQACRSSSGGVVVTPPQTTILPGASQQFIAVVEETAIQDVIWAALGGGTITQTGLFTSNGSIGTFFVTATSVANPDAAGIAQVTVDPAETCLQFGGCAFHGTFHADTPGGGAINDPNLEVTVNPIGGAGASTLFFVLQGICTPFHPWQYAITVAGNGTFSGTGVVNSCDPASTIQGTVTPTSLDFTADLNSLGTGSFTGTVVTKPVVTGRR